MLLNTAPYNHISDFHGAKDGRKAWLALREHYEGEDFVQRLQDKAFSLLNNTFYRGETNRFNFEKYVNIHKQAHKMLQDVNYNGGAGMDQATKCQHFRNNIRLEAGLETSLSSVRAGGAKYADFTSLVSFLSAEVEGKALRKSQLRSSSNRQISSLNKNGGKGGKHGKGKRGSNKNNNGNNDDVPSEVVDGKRVYGRHYPGREFYDLTTAQQNAVKRMRRSANNNGGGGNNNNNSRSISDLRTVFQDSMSQIEERIIAGVSRANQEPGDSVAADDNTTSDEQSGNGRRRTPSGAVGGFLANQRRRHN